MIRATTDSDSCCDVTTSDAWRHAIFRQNQFFVRAMLSLSARVMSPLALVLCGSASAVITLETLKAQFYPEYDSHVTRQDEIRARMADISNDIEYIKKFRGNCMQFVIPRMILEDGLGILHAPCCDWEIAKFFCERSKINPAFVESAIPALRASIASTERDLQGPIESFGYIVGLRAARELLADLEAMDALLRDEASEKEAAEESYGDRLLRMAAAQE